MNVVLWSLSFSVYVIWVMAVAFFMSSDYRLFNSEEQKKHKEGKTFWDWRSPYGVLSTHYVERGNGSNHLLLLHGFRSHTYTWKNLIEPLAEAGYHVWAIDLIGYGLSDKSDANPYTFEFFTSQIRAFMKAHGIESAHIAGNSMGGSLSLQMAIFHPECVKTLTLVNPLGYPLDMPLYIAVGRYIYYVWIPFLGPTWIRDVLKGIVHNKNCITDEQVDAYCLPYRFPGGIISSLLTLRQFDNRWLVEMRKSYPSIKQPILIVWGDQDPLLPDEHYKHFVSDFPAAELVVIKDCGHLPQEEEPEQVLAALTKFLTENRKE